jgi:tight adherence protein C
LLRSLGLLLCGLVSACVGGWLVTRSRVLPPTLGTRGRQRALARRDALFRALEPGLSVVAGLLQPLTSERLRQHIDSKLRLAGEPAGLCAEELVAVVALCALLCTGCAIWLSQSLQLHPSYALYLACVGPYLPFARLSSVARQRAHELERSLPNAMDLCVLCMGAGSDFPQALRFVVDDMRAADTVCHEQLSRVLDDLALGSTRVHALSAMAERTTSQAVREFVAAVCQSEQKGTPLVDSLAIQACTLRAQRSVRAEELAARASVKMMLPMLLLVMSLLLVIFGPFVVSGGGL